MKSSKYDLLFQLKEESFESIQYCNLTSQITNIYEVTLVSDVFTTML